MNLKEHIRKVLEEEISMRTSNQDYSNLIEKIVLDYVDFDICKIVVKKIDNLKDQYLIILMTEKFLKSSYSDELRNHIEELIPFTIYVLIDEGLLDCKKYVKKSNSEQLSESKIPPQVLRRHHLIDEMFKDMRIRYKRLFCNYRNPNILLSVLYERTLEDLYHAWFSETISDDDWEVTAEYIEKYLIDNYEKETIDLWNKRCKNKTSLSEEEELTERCWKGYTQKGMKTMFGKRYPNCVKKTKK